MTAAAKSLVERFRGALARRFVRTGIRYGRRWLTKPGELNILIPDGLAIIGRIRAIEYDCVRDGEAVTARHAFAPGSRPLLAVGTGRSEAFPLGGRYQFTDRGFVDFNSQGVAIDYDEKTGTVKRLK